MAAKTPTPAAASSKRSSKVILGLDLYAWNRVMLLALAGAAIAAIIVGIAQAAIIRLQQRADVEQKVTIARLEKDAADARLEQERLKASFAWRTLDQATANALVTGLAPHPGTVNVWYTAGDPESMFFAIQFVRVLEAAHWKVAPAAANLSGLVFGIALNDATNVDGQSLSSALTSAGVEFSTGPIPPISFTSGARRVQGAPLLMIGSKKPAVFP